MWYTVRGPEKFTTLTRQALWPLVMHKHTHEAHTQNLMRAQKYCSEKPFRVEPKPLKQPLISPV